MSVGRNDPCPCGSGKKYKQCCLAKDAARDSANRRIGLATPGNPKPHLGIPAGAALPDLWEVELVPLLITIGDDPAARPVGILIAAGGFVVHAQMVGNAPAEPAELAPIVVATIADAMQLSGRRPARVHVRHESVARELAPLLDAHGISVAASPNLPSAEDASRSMRERMAGGHPDAPLASQPETWGAWGLEPRQLARLFAASAAYYRAAPWKGVADDHPIHATLASGAEWTAVLLGNAGEEFGLALYRDLADLEALYRADNPRSAFGQVRDAMISITFGAKDDLPPRMRREIHDAGWEVAGPGAYPLLTVLGTPGGGITRRQADDLITLLGTVPRFVAWNEQSLNADIPGTAWADPASGATLGFLAGAVEIEEPLWPIPDVLVPAGPEGPGARPGERIGEDDDVAAIKAELLERFVVYLQRDGPSGGLSDATARKHAYAAQLLLDFLSDYRGIPAQAVTEFDLRDFLYRWYPQKVIVGESAAKTLLGSLRRFFRFLEMEEGIRCPWAQPILADKDAFMIRWGERPVGLNFGQVSTWVGELTADLEARVLIPTPDPLGGIEWGELAGVVEVELYDELHRLWLLWRDEIIRGGVADPERVYDALLPRQRAWATRPNPLAGGATPAKAIAREQKAFRRRMSERS